MSQSVDDLLDQEFKYIQPVTGTVYLVTNTVNGMQYVGSTTTSLPTRMGQHYNKKNLGILGKAIHKYGKSNFTVFALASEVPPDQLTKLEEFYGHQYNTLEPNGYNQVIGKAPSELLRLKKSQDLIKKLQLGEATLPKKAKGSHKVRRVVGTHLITGEIIKLESMSEDPRFNCKNIHACCTGKRRSHGGYKWEYL